MLQLPEPKRRRTGSIRKVQPKGPSAVTPIGKAYADLERAAAKAAGATDAAFSKLDDLLTNQAYLLIGMPAENHDDMLLKIAACGVLADTVDGRYGPLPDWSPAPSGFICDDAPTALLITLRDDLRRLKTV